MTSLSLAPIILPHVHRRNSYEFVDPISASYPRENRESGVLLFFARCKLHHLNLQFLAGIQEASQSLDLLRVMGKHAGKCCHPHQPDWNQSWRELGSLPVPGIPHPDVMDPSLRREGSS